MQEVFEKIIKKLRNELKLADEEKLRCARENALQFDSAKGYANGVANSIEIVKQMAEEYNNGWIPFTQRKLTEEEKKEIGTEYDYMLDCKLPEEDEEILVTYANGTAGEDIFMFDGTDCYLESGNDFITEAIAWRHKPDPYRPNGE